MLAIFSYAGYDRNLRDIIYVSLDADDDRENHPLSPGIFVFRRPCLLASHLIEIMIKPEKTMSAQYTTRILIPSDQDTYRCAAQALQEGDVIAIPTETVYGLAGNAFDTAALDKIFAAKERPALNPLILHISSEQAKTVQDLADAEYINIEGIPEDIITALNRVINAFWPGPLTLVLPRHRRISDRLTGGLETVALRVPAHPVAQKLIGLTFPLAAPSANRSGRISPTSADAVYEELQGRIPFIIDGDACEVGLESSILAYLDGHLRLLRPGAISLKELRRESGIKIASAQKHPAEVRAPGMLQSHYAPDTPVKLFRNEAELQSLLVDRSEASIGVLMLGPATSHDLQEQLSQPRFTVEILSQSRDLTESARQLFATLRRLDHTPCELLLAQVPPQDQGLGQAIRDRLLKASAPRNLFST